VFQCVFFEMRWMIDVWMMESNRGTFPIILKSQGSF